MAKKIGRRRGSKNRGYMLVSGRGWFARDYQGKRVALTDLDGNRLREGADPETVQKAYHRFALDQQAPKRAGGPTVLEVCTAYLDKVQTDGATRTLEMRGPMLYDFCRGRSGWSMDGKHKPGRKIHPGYGDMLAMDLRPYHIDQWIKAHPDWQKSRRMKIAAVLRAMNYSVGAGLLERNPLRGTKLPPINSRATYLTEEQESALIQAARPEIAEALRILIRTGARPGCEFAALTARHVQDLGERMTWTFSPEESKTGKLRVIRITDPDTIATVRRLIGRHRTGPVFRNTRGVGWTVEALSSAFNRLRKVLEAKGMEFDDDCCLYSCRHTFAKRVLTGYWSGKATSIQVLAGLMGNTPQTCEKHYLRWCEHYTEPMWNAV
jgi:integrase